MSQCKALSTGPYRCALPFLVGNPADMHLPDRAALKIDINNAADNTPPAIHPPRLRVLLHKTKIYRLEKKPVRIVFALGFRDLLGVTHVDAFEPVPGGRLGILPWQWGQFGATRPGPDGF